MAAFLDHSSRLLHERFVDREAELAQLVAFLAGPAPVGTVAVTGPPGIGKSALLREFVRCCAELGVPSALVDQAVQRTPEEIAAYAAQQFALPGRTLEELFAANGRRVLLLDHYEPGHELDAALRAAQLAGSGELLLVLAMRQLPPASWLQDADWSALLHVVRLEALSRPAALSYCTRAGIAGDTAERITEVAAGHPLTLTLLVQRAVTRADGLSHAALLEVAEAVLRSAMNTPESDRGAALEIAALAGVASEGTLRAVLEDGDPGALFRWLCVQPITVVTPHGLAVREPFGSFLIDSLVWRDPERVVQLRAQLRAASIDALRRGSSVVRLPHLLRLLALADERGAFRRALVAGLARGLEVGVLRRDEQGAALAMVPVAPMRALLDGWLTHGLALCRGIRDGAGRLLAWTTTLPLDAPAWGTTSDSMALLTALRQAMHVRSGERAVVHLTWITPSEKDSPESLVALAMALHWERALLMPQLAVCGFLSDEATVNRATVWDVFHIQAVRSQWAGMPFVLGVRDWRRRSITEWLAQPDVSEEDAEIVLQGDALDRSLFAVAVVQALRDVSRPERLRGNPLLSSRVVARLAGAGASEPQRIHALRQLLERAIAELGLRPQYRRWQLVAESAYLRPIESQERMAERLGIPFSTYRRYLKSATEWIVEYLWQLEVGDPDGAIRGGELLELPLKSSA
uniref:Orc1-like AAA ATPase domain-containing protein n=1 Tax=Thermomicrobium roseum TaxID=500 RepID=A0A7C1K3Q5_THERO